MRLAKRGGLAILVGTMVCMAGVMPSSAQPTASKIAAQPIAYADLGKMVRSQRGKVVVVDFWSIYCVPCKREFPHLVELHNKYGKDGLVAFSVALDAADDKESRGEVDVFLTKKQATFTNFIVAGSPEDWYKQLKIPSIPSVFVFDRENRRILKLVGEEVDYKKAVEPEVIKLLKQ